MWAVVTLASCGVPRHKRRCTAAWRTHQEGTLADVAVRSVSSSHMQGARRRYLWGPVAGTAVVSAGSTAGAALAFLVSRYAARPLVAERLGRSARFRAIDAGVGRSGAKARPRSPAKRTMGHQCSAEYPIMRNKECPVGACVYWDVDVRGIQCSFHDAACRRSALLSA